MKLCGAIKNFSKSIQLLHLLSKYIIRGDSLRDLRNRDFRSAAFKRGFTLIRVQTDFSFYEHRFVTRFYVITFYCSRRASMRRLLYNFVPRFDWQPTTLWCRLQYCVWSMTNLTRPWMNVDILLCSTSANYATLPLSTLKRSRQGRGMFACKAIYCKVSV